MEAYRPNQSWASEYPEEDNLLSEERVSFERKYIGIIKSSDFITKLENWIAGIKHAKQFAEHVLGMQKENLFMHQRDATGEFSILFTLQTKVCGVIGMVGVA